MLEKKIFLFEKNDFNKKGKTNYTQEDFWNDAKQVLKSIPEKSAVNLSNLKAIYNDFFNNEKLLLFIYDKIFEMKKGNKYCLNKRVETDDTVSSSWRNNYGTSISHGCTDGNSYSNTDKNYTDGTSADNYYNYQNTASECSVGTTGNYSRICYIIKTYLSLIDIKADTIIIQKEKQRIGYNGHSNSISILEKMNVPIYDKMPIDIVGPYAIKVNIDSNDYIKKLDELLFFCKTKQIKLLK